MQKRILLYYPPNGRSIAIETLCRAMKEAGYEMLVLTLSDRGPIHAVMEDMGIPVYAHVVSRKPSRRFYYHHVRFLVQFCKTHGIDTIWSHLQEANFIAVIARMFSRTRIRLVTFRHHDESSFYAEYGKKFGMVRNRKEVFIDRFINRFAPTIVVLSRQVLKTMTVYEKCDPRKIVVCPLIYDFSLYPTPDAEAVKAIREKMDCHLLLIMVSRMIESKQHLAVFEALKKLDDEGLSVKMIVMDEGPLRPMLQDFIDKNSLEKKIWMVGYKSDLINYIAASDMLVHPSLTEASNNVVKEMGLLNKPVIVCRNVGDFDDYIREEVNGYLISRSDLQGSLEASLRDAYAHPQTLGILGANLHREVVQRFSDTTENKQRFLQLV